VIRNANTMATADLHKKWWIFILHFVLNVSCELFHLIRPDKSSPSIAHGNRQLTFRRNLVRQRNGTFTSRKRTGRKRSLSIRTAFLFLALQNISGRAKVCASCIDKKKKAPSGRGKQTKYKCMQCDLPL
jgi:hypothetical protein